MVCLLLEMMSERWNLIAYLYTENDRLCCKRGTKDQPEPCPSHTHLYLAYTSQRMVELSKSLISRCQRRNAAESDVPPSRGLRCHAGPECRFQARPRPNIHQRSRVTWHSWSGPSSLPWVVLARALSTRERALHEILSPAVSSFTICDTGYTIYRT